MTKIVYSKHLEYRLKFRKIPRELPINIYKTSQERYHDQATNKNIAIGEMKIQRKLREIALVYEQTTDKTVFITIHPLKISQKSHRIKSERWKII